MAFSGILNPDTTGSKNGDTDSDNNVAAANDGITLQEVVDAVGLEHKHKAPGGDKIPSDALQTSRIIIALHKLFSFCFRNSVFPNEWTQSSSILFLRQDPKTPEIHYRPGGSV